MITALAAALGALVGAIVAWVAKPAKLLIHKAQTYEGAAEHWFDIAHNGLTHHELVQRLKPTKE